MSAPLFEHVLVPVASRSDAEMTCDALVPYLAGTGGTATIVYVIEKAGGAPDKASVEQLKEEADRIFDITIEKLVNADIEFDTRLLFGTDVAQTILDAAADEKASAIVFTPRGSNRLIKLLTGDVSDSLIQHTDRPVVVLPSTGDCR